MELREAERKTRGYCLSYEIIGGDIISKLDKLPGLAQEYHDIQEARNILVPV